ncbi:hypothetical protein GPJ56_005212 [Histomonas meleagridis]|uniref:uncharacterized protein n=1 Tax=Histomonas meleagridis TaxID=135588 RepID=UPI00355A3DBF|nr:hypothetical protein GPJ56_005212 [Histomonas meleagridis]KAH0802062.1 hypothetical protein GO595_005143 [Histomonas meleagridis]
MELVKTYGPCAICATTSLLLYLKVQSVENKQDKILEEVAEIKGSLSQSSLAEAILQATNATKDKKDKKKDKKKKDKKDKKDKKKDKKKKDKKDKKGKKDKKDKKKKDKKKK